MLELDRNRDLLLVKRQLSCDSESAWRILTTVTKWPQWGPLISGVNYSYDRIQEGTSGYIRLIAGISIPFKIETVTDGYWTWSIWGLTPPTVGHRVESVDDQTSRITFELPLWAFWYAPICYYALVNISKLIDPVDQ